MNTQTKDHIGGVLCTLHHDAAESGNAEKMKQLRDVARPVAQIAKALGDNWEIAVRNHWYYLLRDGGAECLDSTTGVTISGCIKEEEKFYFTVDKVDGKYIYRGKEEFGEHKMYSAVSKPPATISKEIERRILKTAEEYAKYCRERMMDALMDERHQLRLIEKYSEMFCSVPSSQWERKNRDKRIAEAIKGANTWHCNWAGASISIPGFRSQKLKLEFGELSEEEADTLMFWYRTLQEEKTAK